MQITPHKDWFSWLSPYFNAPTFKALQSKLNEQPAHQVFPPAGLRYATLTRAPEDIKVIILGQDPYHGRGQAMGLSFSVPEGVPTPPSLMNIYKEIQQEGGQAAAGRTGDLTPWADQGVLLLNTALSVHEGQAGSHRGWGWEPFTDGIIKELAQRRTGLVFLLWGKPAQEKAHLIPKDKGHLVLTAPHPSPLSAHRGFLGCGHFNQANQFLESQGLSPIRW
jgi:uracil-DNA glycosylase